MSDPNRLLAAIREELRSSILPRIEGDYERSVVIAMLGILGDLRGRLALDDAAPAAFAAGFRAAADGWADVLRPHRQDLAEALRAALARADAAPRGTARRALLLEAAEALVREIWRDAALRAAAPGLLPSIRRALAADWAPPAKS